jgi:cytochrome c oxidase subunit II
MRSTGRRRRVVAATVGLVIGPLALGACGDHESMEPTSAELSGQAREGQGLVRQLGCVSCHSVDGRDGVGPSFKGRFGTEVELADGTTAVVDPAYLTESIVEPEARTAAGYRPIMPKRDLAPDQVAAIVAYIEGLNTTSAPTTTAAG